MLRTKLIRVAALVVLTLSACTFHTPPENLDVAVAESPSARPDEPGKESLGSTRQPLQPIELKEGAATASQDPDAAAAEAFITQQVKTEQLPRQRHPAVAEAKRLAAPPATANLAPSKAFINPNLSGLRPPAESVDRETYAHIDENTIKRTTEHPVSTFSIDVDTGAYSNIRRLLNVGRLPPHDAVRVEELINYFSYDYPVPDENSGPFNVITELGPTPWNPASYLLHIGLKGYELPKEAIPAANLVFLIDVSGSMQSPSKLELLKSSLKLLAKALRPQDRIAIVVYAGASGIVLDTVAGDQKAKVLGALEGLTAGGSTNGGAGIRLAYTMAEQAFIPGGVNRVLLATDGDFNVGTVSFETLKNLIEEKRKTGISLTTLGFGTGNYNDQLMEQLADVGNGHYAYIDNLNEARKVLLEEMTSTLHTIAKDVKIQIEFNPDQVAEYRLIGYENRALNREDFNNDNVDAGEIGAGHSVTALYEIALAGSGGERIDALRYQPEETAGDHPNNELAYLRLRYKTPDSEKSALLAQPILVSDIIDELNNTTERFRYAAAVAAFGQLLRGGKYTETYHYDNVLALARRSRGEDTFGYRGEFLTLVNLATSLSSQQGRVGN